MSLVPQYLWEQDCCTRIKHLLSTNLAEQGWKLQLTEWQIIMHKPFFSFVTKKLYLDVKL